MLHMWMMLSSDHAPKRAWKYGERRTTSRLADGQWREVSDLKSSLKTDETCLGELNVSW